MHDPVEVPLEGGLDHLGIGDVTAHDLNVGIGMSLQVHDPHVRASRRQRSYRVAADEARPTRHQNPLPGQSTR